VRARSFKGEPFRRELEKAEQLRFLAQRNGQTFAQAAIAFCLAHPAVSTTIPGARNARQMRENAAGADVIIPPEHLQRIDELWRSSFSS
jgi:aryl-alcohol dehydrogenase-like predicted oxidoreductase